MPLYEYRCTDCGYSFEKIQSFKAEPERVCPKCQGVLIRPVTAPALRFEGAGWYVNDYAGKGGAKAGEAASATGPSETSKSTETKSTTGEASASPAPAASPSAAPAAAPAASTAK